MYPLFIADINNPLIISKLKREAGIVRDLYPLFIVDSATYLVDVVKYAAYVVIVHIVDR